MFHPLWSSLGSVRWSRVKEVLGDALELPASGRAAYLDKACGPGSGTRGKKWKRCLKRARMRQDFIETPALAQSDDWLSGLIGSRIGPYRVVELLGEGGMGAVYRAVRDDGEFHQQIAIKLVKRGMDTNAILRRFRAERRILAGSITRISASSSTAGLPTMACLTSSWSILQGTPIQDYCQQGRLSVAERLNLFIASLQRRRVLASQSRRPSRSQGEEHGRHRRRRSEAAGFRDSQIARIAIASTNNPDPTMAADRLFTPDYASPEQIRGETDNHRSRYLLTRRVACTRF